MANQKSIKETPNLENSLHDDNHKEKIKSIEDKLYQLEIFDVFIEFGIDFRDKYLLVDNKAKFEFRDTICNMLNEIIYETNKYDYYWHFCSLKTYKATLENRFAEYKKNVVDAELKDFCMNELVIINSQFVEFYYYDSDTGYPTETGHYYFSYFLNPHIIIYNDFGYTYDNLELSWHKKKK